MRARDLLLGAPVPRWLLPTLAVVVAAVTWLSSRTPLGGPYVTWPAVSQQWHETVWGAGAVLVAGAAFVGSLVPARRSALTPPLRARGGATSVAALAIASGLWGMVGHAAGMTAGVVRAVLTASWGHMYLADVAIGSLGVLVLGMMGSCAGQLVGHWLIAPLAGLVAAGVLALPRLLALRPWALLQPVQQWHASVRFVLTGPTTVFTLVAMTAGALAVVWATGWWRGGRGRPNGGDVAVLLVPVLLIGMAFVWRPEFYRVADATPRVCQETHGIQICLHQAHAPSLDDAVAATSALAEAGMGPLLQRVTDKTVADYTEPGPGEVLVDVRLRGRPETLLTQTMRQMFVGQIAEELVMNRCTRNPDRAAHAWATSQVLTRTYLRHAGFVDLAVGMGGASSDTTALTSWISGASTHELGQWTARHRQDILTCQQYPTQAP